MPKHEQDTWSARLEDEPLSDLVLEELKSGSRKDVQRIRRILSVGSRWTAEEIILIVGIRIELDLILHFLTHRLSVEPELAMEDIDEAIVAFKVEGTSASFQMGRWNDQKELGSAN